jgi:hypothetical protein
MKVQTELATRLAGIERALDKGESKKGQNLSAIISAIGIIMSFLLGATSLLMQILRFGAKP